MSHHRSSGEIRFGAKASGSPPQEPISIREIFPVVTDAVVALTTIGTREQAQALAELLVAEELAACVSIVGPVHSTYRWKGAVQRAEEFQLIVKTASTSLSRVEETIHKFHKTLPDGYEMPEFILLRVEGGSSAYIAWLLENSQSR